MRASGAQVTTSESVLFELLGTFRGRSCAEIVGGSLRHPDRVRPIEADPRPAILLGDDSNTVDASHSEFRQVSGLVKQTKTDTAEALAALVARGE